MKKKEKKEKKMFWKVKTAKKLIHEYFCMFGKIRLSLLETINECIQRYAIIVEYF